MPTWLKITLVIAGLLVLLVVGLVVAGVYVVRRYGPEVAQATKRYVEEGREYGRRTDNEGCVNEAAARQARAEGFGDMLKNNLFIRACLEASRPTPGFCDDVPRASEFMKAVGWQAQQCQRYGLTPQKQCSQLFQQVQVFCEARRMAGDADANTSGEDESPPPPAPVPTPKRPARPR